MQEYNQADEQLHQLSQTIAKFNRSFAAPKEDDSHTNLGFDVLGMRLLGKWVDSTQGKVIMALDFSEYTFQICNASWEILFSAEIIDQTQAEIESDIQSFLADLGLDGDAFAKPLHYEIPAYDFADKPFEAPNPEYLGLWIGQRTLANDACQWLANHLQLNVEVRIWPHHFDTGIYVEPTQSLGLGYGLAMKDGTLEEAYYYFTGYGLKGHDIDFESVVELTAGTWAIDDQFKAAVLRLSDVDANNVSIFTREALNWYLAH